MTANRQSNEERLAEALEQFKQDWWSRWLDDSVTPEEDCARRTKRLAQLERRWRDGLEARSEAKFICRQEGLRLPPWTTAAGLKEDTAKAKKQPRGAFDIDKLRWEIVSKLLARREELGLTRETVFKAAATVCAGSWFGGGEHTMERAYKAIETVRKREVAEDPNNPYLRFAWRLVE
jgi:hypothetical protein